MVMSLSPVALKFDFNLFIVTRQNVVLKVRQHEQPYAYFKFP